MPPFENRDVVISDVFTRDTLASAMRVLNSQQLVANAMILNNDTMEMLLKTVIKFGDPLHLPDVQYEILSLRKMQ